LVVPSLSGTSKMGDENVEMILLPIFFFVVLSRKVWESNPGTKREEDKIAKF
jgi:hypothetical protein